MQWRNSSERYGLVAIGLHWLMALTVCALFALGLWMTSLDYYHSWYHRAPALHKSIGMVLFAMVVVRLQWRLFKRQPEPLPSHSRFEQVAARGVHALLYLGLLAVMVAGYLISTADGRAIEVFGLLSIPATITSIPEQEDAAGATHLALAIMLITLAALHATAALKHHFVDRDNTLRRMLGR